MEFSLGLPACLIEQVRKNNKMALAEAKAINDSVVRGFLPLSIISTAKYTPPLILFQFLMIRLQGGHEVPGL
jgi:hypothetical protein